MGARARADTSAQRVGQPCAPPSCACTGMPRTSLEPSVQQLDEPHPQRGAGRQGHPTPAHLAPQVVPVLGPGSEGIKPAARGEPTRLGVQERSEPGQSGRPHGRWGMRQCIEEGLVGAGGHMAGGARACAGAGGLQAAPGGQRRRASAPLWAHSNRAQERQAQRRAGL